MNLTHIKYSLLLPLLLLLSSCQDYNGMKQRLVNGYQGLDAYCLYVGRITGFPYLAAPLDIWLEDRKNISHTTRVDERLAAFEQAGLLSSELAVGKDSKAYPLYSLTEEGKRYYKTNRTAGFVDIENLNDVQFCFGRREILDVTDMHDRETDFYGGKTTETVVKFTYNLHDVPAWVNHPAIKGIKQYNEDFTGDLNNLKWQLSLTKKDGTYYNYATSPAIETTLLGYYL